MYDSGTFFFGLLAATVLGMYIYKGFHIPPPGAKSVVRPSILRRRIIVIQRDGCMAHIFTETDRGHIIGVYKDHNMIQMYLCERLNGTCFSAIVDRCQGPHHGADVSERLGEDVTGTIIEFT